MYVARCAQNRSSSEKRSVLRLPLLAKEGLDAIATAIADGVVGSESPYATASLAAIVWRVLPVPSGAR